MNKKIIKAVISHILLFSANVFSALFYTPYLLNKLGSEAYAFYPLSLGIINFASVITVIFTSMLSAFLVNDYREGNSGKINEFINSSLFSNFLTALLVSIPFLFVSFFADSILNIPKRLIFEVKILFLSVTCAFFAAQIRNSFMITAMASGNRYLNNSQKAIEKFMAVIIPVILFIFIKPSVAWVGISLLSACIIRFLITIHSAKKIFPALEINKKHIKKSVVKTLFSSGSWNAITQLIFILSVNVSAPLSNIIFGAKVQSFYSVGAQLPSQLGHLFVYTINSFMLFFVVLFKNKDYDNLKKDIVSILKVVSALLGMTAALLAGLGDCFLKLWISDFYNESIYIITILYSVSFMITGSFYVVYSILIVYNKVKIPAVFMIVTGILNIPLAIILIKLTNRSIYSIAVSSVITGIIQYVVFIPYYFTRKTNMKKGGLYPSFAKGIYTFGMGVGISFIIKILFYPDSFLKLLAVTVAVILLTAVSSRIFFIKRGDLSMIKRIIKANIEYRNDLSELQGSDYDSIL